MVSAVRWWSSRLPSCGGARRSFAAARTTFAGRGSLDSTAFCGSSSSLQAGEDEESVVGGCRRVALLRRARLVLRKKGGAFALVSGGRRRGRAGGGRSRGLFIAQIPVLALDGFCGIFNVVGSACWFRCVECLPSSFLAACCRRSEEARGVVDPGFAGRGAFLSLFVLCVCVVILRITNSLQIKKKKKIYIYIYFLFNNFQLLPFKKLTDSSRTIQK